MVVRKWSGLSIFIGIAGIIMFFAWMFSEREVPSKVIFWGMIGLIMYLSVWFQHLYYALKAQNTAKIVLLIFLPLIGIILCELLPDEIDNTPALPEESSSEPNVSDKFLSGVGVTLALPVILILAVSVYALLTGFCWIAVAIWGEGPLLAIVLFGITSPLSLGIHYKIIHKILGSTGIQKKSYSVWGAITMLLITALIIVLIGMVKGWGRL